MPSLKSFDSKKKGKEKNIRWIQGNIGFVESLLKPYLNIIFGTI